MSKNIIRNIILTIVVVILGLTIRHGILFMLTAAAWATPFAISSMQSKSKHNRIA